MAPGTIERCRGKNTKSKVGGAIAIREYRSQENVTYSVGSIRIQVTSWFICEKDLWIVN